METGWIQVFILTLTQCIAPAGKMVCEEQSVEFQFADQVDCEVALAQMLDVAARVDSVIVRPESSHCRAASKEVTVFDSAASAGAPFGTDTAIANETDSARPADFIESAHQERLKTLHNCDEVAGVAPCKIGEIIVEPAEEGEAVEIWRRPN